MNDHDPLLTAEQVAERMSVGTDTVRRWARKGLLASTRLPGAGRPAYRFRTSDVEVLIARTTEPQVVTA